MFRTSLVCAQKVLKNVVAKQGAMAPVAARYMSKKTETDEEKDARYEAFFNRSDLDGYDLRRGINEMFGEDMVPEPKILVACLKAIRKENDFAMAVRLLEAVKAKAGEHAGTIYPYIIQELRPTLTELGISTPEELGYDKPELALENVYEM